MTKRQLSGLLRVSLKGPELRAMRKGRFVGGIRLAAFSSFSRLAAIRSAVAGNFSRIFYPRQSRAGPPAQG